MYGCFCRFVPGGSYDVTRLQARGRADGDAAGTSLSGFGLGRRLALELGLAVTVPQEEAWWSKVEAPQLRGGLTRAPGATARLQAAEAALGAA